MGDQGRQNSGQRLLHSLERLSSGGSRADSDVFFAGCTDDSPRLPKGGLWRSRSPQRLQTRGGLYDPWRARKCSQAEISGW